MPVEAEAESVDESYGDVVKGGLAHLLCTRAVCLQALLDNPQKNSKNRVYYCPVAVQPVVQPLRHR